LLADGDRFRALAEGLLQSLQLDAGALLLGVPLLRELACKPK
jgi:hypothetical protein